MEENIVSRLTSHKVHSALPVADILEDASDGLIDSPRSMPPKYFYDKRGSQLFDSICETREYYPTRTEAAAFLDEVRAIMRPGDGLLLGADRVKDVEVLHAAYNDDSGVTAQFNLNLLQVLNRELDADFCGENFEHRALFNSEASQIEMYLVSRRRQSVRIQVLKCTLELEAGERILTEISRKFTAAHLESLLTDAGFAIQSHFEPDNGWFSLVLAGPQDTPVIQS